MAVLPLQRNSGILVKQSSSQAGQKTVPLLDLKRQYATIRAEVREAIDRVCESQSLILGEEVAALEREISAFLGVNDTVACASGTDALVAGHGRRRCSVPAIWC